MRLLETSSRGGPNLTKYLTENIPPYAILSHTWGADEEEITLKDLQDGTGKSKNGYAKIVFCAEQAQKDGLQHFWVDTCSIDKANHTELSEAIASMFRWYRNAAKCYVYLSDVSARKCEHDSQTAQTWESAFRKSRWFTRGWTLQELIAPYTVEFFSREREYLGDKKMLEQQIHEVTGIPIDALRGEPLSNFSVDERMRWAAKRTTTRKEDKAYCLWGVFDVFLPLIYGEGDNAFVRLQEEIARVSQKNTRILDKLPYARGAIFNSYDEDHTTCHPKTRIDLLQQIQQWAQDPHSKSIFWLNGMAGTGKSTISWTFAKWLTEQGRHAATDLGASFFFKRGEGDRGSASRFHPTIVRDLALKVPGLDRLVAEVIDDDPSVFDKALGEQFNKLIYQPLQKVNSIPGSCPTLIVVVDALDECEKARDIDIILGLWSQLPQITTIRIKLFLTSRPDLPILQKFKKIPTNDHHDMILHDEVPRTTIRNDILIFLKDKFELIREDYNDDPPSGTLLDDHWPGDQTLQALLDMAVPLFIVAATVCRYVGDSNWNPQERLETILQFQATGHLEQMELTYLPVLTQVSMLFNKSHEKEKLHQDFRMILGSIVTLTEPLSITSLAVLLLIPRDVIVLRLRLLHSVLHVPVDVETPVRILHQSFPEFLLSDKLQGQPFGVDGPAMHRILLLRCLDLLSGSIGLRENLCELRYPGQLRRDIGQATIAERLSAALQYACVHWVYHAQRSKVEIHDDDEVHVFLKKDFLHWLEAMSLLNRIADVIGYIGVLQQSISTNSCRVLSSFLEDARRFVLANQYIADLAPLQIYSSATIFAPQQSIVRNVCGQIPEWIERCPTTVAKWTSELQRLEGHMGSVLTVAFSPDGSLLASGSNDGTVKLWNTATGREVQRLKGHPYGVTAVAFSPDGSLLASGSMDYTVRLWNIATGREVQRLEGHVDGVTAVAFSPDGSLPELLLASGSEDSTIRLWSIKTDQEVQRLKGHSRSVRAVAFSPDGSRLASASFDSTVRLWNTVTGQAVQRFYTGYAWMVAFSPNGSLALSLNNIVRLCDTATGQEVQKFEGHTEIVEGVAFSPDGGLLASASSDNTVRLWDTGTGQELQRFEGHTHRVSAVSFSPDRPVLASASADGTVRLWATAIDTVTDQEVQMFQGHDKGITTILFSCDGSLVVTGSHDRTVGLWNTATGQEVQRFEGHSAAVYAVALSRNSLLLASGSEDQTVRVWNTATGQEVQRVEAHHWGDNTIAFSPDGSLLATGLVDSTVRLWDVATGQEVQRLEGHLDFACAVAFSSNRSLLASGSSDRSVILWHIATGKKTQWLKGHTQSVKAVAFSPNGSLLASVSSDRTIRLWNTDTGHEVQKFENMSTVSDIRFTDNNTILTNRGAIFVHNASGLSQITPSSTKITTTIEKDWIRQDDHNLLWLPEEYRIAKSACYDDTFVFGLYSGQVRFIQLGRC